MHREFERTPKAGAAEAQVSAPVKKSSHAVKVHWPYVLTEAFFVVHHVYLAFFYGDHAGKVCFAFDRRRLRIPAVAKSQ